MLLLALLYSTSASKVKRKFCQKIVKKILNIKIVNICICKYKKIVTDKKHVFTVKNVFWQYTRMLFLLHLFLYLCFFVRFRNVFCIFLKSFLQFYHKLFKLFNFFKLLFRNIMFLLIFLNIFFKFIIFKI